MMTKTAAHIVALVLVVCGAVACSQSLRGTGDTTRLPAQQRVVLLFKSMTYDRNLANSRDALRVGVVARAGDEASEKAAREVLEQVRAVQHIRIRGLALSGQQLDVRDGGALTGAVADARVNVIYLSTGIEGFLEDACKLATLKKIVVISGEAAYAHRCAALTVVRRGTKPRVLLNLKAAEAQGASYDPALIKAADLVE